MSTHLKLSTLAITAILLQPLTAEAALLPVSSGLVLNFQADNINGAGNVGMADGQNVDTWTDIVQAGGNAVANNATSATVSTAMVDYLGPNASAGNPITFAPPTFVADTGSGIPGVKFTRTSATALTALGNNTAVDGLLDNNAFTAFVVGNLGNPGPARMFQMGRRNGADAQVVGLANNGFRFNGGSRLYNENMIGAPHITTFTMDLLQNYDAPTYRFDGVAGTFLSGGGATTLNLTNFNHGFALGAGQNNGNFTIDGTTGVLNAVVIYNRILSPSEIEAVESALKTAYIVPEPSSMAMLAIAMFGVSRRPGVGRRMIGQML